MLSVSLLFTGFSVLLPFQNLVFAQRKAPSKNQKNKIRKRKKRRNSGQAANVVVDGSAVYRAQNFDAPVMEYLDRGKKIRISKKVYPGIGGLGTFYKVRLRKGVYGYITDTDIEISGTKGVLNTKKQLSRSKEDSSPNPLEIQDSLEREEPSVNFGSSVYLTRFLGLSFSSVDYSETIAGSKKSSKESLFGLKLSGPGKVMGGMPLDIELKILASAPSFYSDFSTASGYMLMGHAYAMFPIVLDTQRHVLYYQFGPMLKYTAFDVKLDASSLNVDSQEISLGLGLGLGYALRFTKDWLVRFDAIYQNEAESYLEMSAALQMQY